MPFKLFFAVFFFFIFSVTNAQSVTVNDTVHLIYGVLTYQGQTIFITDNGFRISKGNWGNYTKKGNTNEIYSKYYKKIYGENTENPNFVIDGENISFIPFVNINELYGDSHQLVNEISVSELAKTFADKNYPNRKEVLTKLKNLLNNKTFRGN